MIFKQIKVGEMENFSYIIGDSGEAAIVDPGWECDKLVKICKKENLKITKILLTHGHFDHVQELGNLVKETKAEVYVHKKEVMKFKGEIKFVKDGDRINLGRMKIDAIHTPGHTAGSVCYLINYEKLLTGDTLFVNGIGRTDLPGGSAKEMEKSLRRLSELGDEIEVYPGHDYGGASSTIGDEKKHNPFMKFE
jgi:hydroxyacylglutathione hydrolase